MKKYVTYLGLLGLLSIAAGAVAYAIRAEMTLIIGAVIWGGILLSILFIYVNFAEVKAAFSGRAVKYGMNSVIMAGVFTGILVMAAFMSMKYKVRSDLTATKRYTLSEQTRKILKSLKKDVEVIAFYRSDERTKQAMDDLLENYSAAGSHLTYWFVDPDKKPGIAEKYGVTSYRTTLVRSGAKQDVVSYESEERLTNAILKVTKEGAKTMCFLTGHGENSVNDDQKAGYKAAKESIEKENLAVAELFIVDKNEVPENCGVVIVGGPKKDLFPVELEKLTAYIDGGGSVLFMLDPYAAPKLAGYLGGLGFRLGNDIIVDMLSKVFGANHLVPVVTSYEKDHPITKEFSLMTFFPLTRSVAVEKNPEKGAYVLASSGGSSWAETDRKALEDGKASFTEGKDMRGPVPIASVVVREAGLAKKEKVKTPEAKEERKIYSKIAVIGDSDFVNNANINLAGNRDFFLNTVSWLAEEADLIAIRKKDSRMTPVLLTAAGARFIFWMGVIVPPSVVAVFGIGFFIRRRSRK